jgi:hypothetical protein
MDSNIQKHLSKALTTAKAEVLLDDWVRLKSILKDFCPSLHKEISVVSSFQVHQLANELFHSSQEVSELDFMKLAERFATVTAYDRKTAEWGVLIWCNALDKKLKFSYKSLKYPPPIIKSFNTSESEVVNGEKTVVSWSVENAVKVFFNFQGKEVEVKAFDSKEVQIKKDESVLIKVIGFFEHPVIDRREIKVINKVKIREFKSDLGKVVSGNPVRLWWKVDNATEVKISGVTTIFKAKDETIVYPTISTTYILTATNKAGSDTTARGVRAIQTPTYEKERLIKLPQLRGFTFKQKSELVIPTIHHSPIRIHFPSNNLHYSTFNKTRRKFLSGFLFSLKEKAKIMFSAS